MKKLLLSLLFLSFSVHAWDSSDVPELNPVFQDHEIILAFRPNMSPMEPVNIWRGMDATLPPSVGCSLSETANQTAWYQKGVGVTVTGAGVSTWADQANSNDLLQGTDTNRPAFNAGTGEITFDGVDNFLLDAFTLAQPATWYILFKQVTWTGGDVIFDGIPAASNKLEQRTVTPLLRGSADVNLLGPAAGLTLNNFGAVSVVFNGASGVVAISDNGGAISETTGDIGIDTGDGITLGARGGGANFSNIVVKEVIIYSAAHDTATRTLVIEYLNCVGDLAFNFLENPMIAANDDLRMAA